MNTIRVGTPPPDVEVWLVDLDAASTPDHTGMLDSRERTRAAALVHARDRERYVTAHGVLRILVSRAMHIAHEAQVGAVRMRRQPCPMCGGPHGRPFVEGGPFFSLSRSGAWALVALSNVVPVGVDIEVRRDPADVELLRASVLADGERSDDLLRTWVRKEAFLKSTGEGLARPMNTVAATPGTFDLGEGAGSGRASSTANLVMAVTAAASTQVPLLRAYVR